MPLRSRIASRSLAGATGTGATGTLGTVSGISTQTVTGATTTGVIFADYSDGLTGIHIRAGTAYAYKTATAGAQHHRRPDRQEHRSYQSEQHQRRERPLYSRNNFGIHGTAIYEGAAFASGSYAKAVATGAASTLAGIYGNAVTTITGTTIGTSANVTAQSVYGINGLKELAGTAAGYKASTGTGAVASGSSVTSSGPPPLPRPPREPRHRCTLESRAPRSMESPV